MNRIAVITGASSGIGRAVGRALGAHGATLCLLGRNVDSVEIMGPRVLKMAVDLGDESQIHDVVRRLLGELGGVDILVHSAGVYVPAATGLAGTPDLDLQHRVNVQAPAVLTHDLLPTLRDRRGQVVFINSSAARNTSATDNPYAAGKRALKAFADNLRNDVNSAEVRVLTVFPGRTASPMQESIHRIEGKPYLPERLLQPEDVASVVLNAICLPFTAEVTEIDIRPMKKPPN